MFCTGVVDYLCYSKHPDYFYFDLNDLIISFDTVFCPCYQRRIMCSLIIMLFISSLTGFSQPTHHKLIAKERA